jgi:hypothetical protein
MRRLRTLVCAFVFMACLLAGCKREPEKLGEPEELRDERRQKHEKLVPKAGVSP